MSEIHTWQCILICWGTKYGEKDILTLSNRIAKFAENTPRFVLITDRHRDLPDHIIQRPMPAFYNQPIHQTGGCQAKLSMFQKNVVPDDLPAIFVDLDTVILGDISTALTFNDPTKTLQMLESSLLPFCTVTRWLTRITNHKINTRGNSSIVVFHPKHCNAIDIGFREAFSNLCDPKAKYMRADDRFISHFAYEKIRALPTSFAVKFPTEYMLHTKWLTILKTKLPWIKRRRLHLKAITLPGELSKPDQLLGLQDGEILKDNRGRYLIWSDTAIGPMRQTLIQYAKDLTS